MCGDLSLPQARGVPGRQALGGPREGSSDVRGRQLRVPGLAVAALKTFQRACHGDAQRPSRPHAAAPPAGNFLPPAAVSLSLSDAPPPGPLPAARSLPLAEDGPRAAARGALSRPGRWRRRPSAPPPPSCPARGACKWPGRVPRPDCRRASERAGRRGRGGPASQAPEQAAAAHFPPMVHSDMAKSPPSAAAAAAQELPMDALESAAPAGALGAAAQVATAPRLRLPL